MHIGSALSHLIYVTIMTRSSRGRRIPLPSLPYRTDRLDDAHWEGFGVLVEEATGSSCWILGYAYKQIALHRTSFYWGMITFILVSASRRREEVCISIQNARILPAPHCLSSQSREFTPHDLSLPQALRP